MHWEISPFSKKHRYDKGGKRKQELERWRKKGYFLIMN